MASVARSVRDYIDTHPVVRDALALGIVNLSALTRRIQDATGIEQEDAVLVACRRYRPREKEAGYEAAIREVLDKARLEVRTRVAVLRARSSWRLMARLDKARTAMKGSDHVHVLQGSEAITIMLDENLVAQVKDILGPEEILEEQTGLAELNIRTPSLVADVPGILSFLVSSLSERGINLLDVISCHKDNMFLLEKQDLHEAMEVLDTVIQG